MTLLRLFLFIILKGILADENVTKPHSNVQLWRAEGDFSEEVTEIFYDRARFTEDIWKRDEHTIDFVINESEIPYVTDFLALYNISHKVLLKDFDGRIDDALVKAIPFRRSGDDERIDDAIVGSNRFRRSAMSGDSFKWTAYPSLAEINKYLAKMAAKFPAHCSLTTIGRTIHNKPINMLKISNGNKDNAEILIDGGTHGSEWASVISALYFIDTGVNNYAQKPEYFKTKNWHIIPVLNPDGYEYSMNTDHLWRKNRRRFGGNMYGVNLNRNFDYNWCQRGASHMISSPSYCGPDPFSEEETKAFKRVVDGTRFEGYLSIHSSGTKVLYPWKSHDADHEVVNKHLHFTKQIGMAMSKIANNHFTNGNAQSLGFDQGSGMAIDWMFFVRQVTHSYMIETRGRPGPSLLEVSEILPAAKEVRAGILRFAEILK